MVRKFDNGGIFDNQNMIFGNNSFSKNENDTYFVTKNFITKLSKTESQAPESPKAADISRLEKVSQLIEYT